MAMWWQTGSQMPAAVVLALLVLLIGTVPAGASPIRPVGRFTPGLHGAEGAPEAPPVSGAPGPAAPAHTVPERACSSWAPVKRPSRGLLHGVVATSTPIAWEGS